MTTNEEIRKENQADLLAAQKGLLRRIEDVNASFESSLNLLKALMNLIVQDEISDDDAVAINEILMILTDTVRGGYARYRLE